MISIVANKSEELLKFNLTVAVGIEGIEQGLQIFIVGDDVDLLEHVFKLVDIEHSVVIAVKVSE